MDYFKYFLITQKKIHLIVLQANTKAKNIRKYGPTMKIKKRKMEIRTSITSIYNLPHMLVKLSTFNQILMARILQIRYNCNRKKGFLWHLIQDL